jgi:threonylcarbamoyladenosine tRNA methylthiotransferase MtaB
MTIEVLSFGCRLNTYEGEVMRGHARTAGLSDTIIVNTCAVTAEAERQARQAIRRLGREKPDATIVVTGCAAQIDPAGWRQIPGVTRVLGNAEKLDAAHWAPGAGSAVSDIMAARETAAHLVTEFAGRARAFVQVQQGCDHRCTFCVIPFGRGPSRSVPLGAILDQCRSLIASGYREIVLTGVDITSYGADLPGRPPLGQIVRRLLALLPELPRLRLSSLDPCEIDDDLWRLIAEEPRLMPHLHLSIQAGSDLILKRMKRRHLRADVLAVARRARDLRPGIAFGASSPASRPRPRPTSPTRWRWSRRPTSPCCMCSHTPSGPGHRRRGCRACRRPCGGNVPPACAPRVARPPRASTRPASAAPCGCWRRRRRAAIASISARCVFRPRRRPAPS